ncbi:MAG: PHP-associated domain-containing protein, partial [Candidatus Auribacterota bacterium]|nr:PHP-associated domain-containing protein [Candidatus Auribacterota bacterium]
FKDKNNLVVAAHPYYWIGKCLKGDLVKNIALFDAVEISHFFTSWLNPNKKAFNTAKKHNLPLLSFSDCHTLDMFGKNYSYVYVKEASVDGIIDGIKSGRVEYVAPPLSSIELFKEILSKRKHLKYIFLGSPEENFLRLKKEGKLPKDFKL